MRRIWAQSQRMRPPSKDGAAVRRGPRDRGWRETRWAWTASKVARSMIWGISYSMISEEALRVANFSVEFVEATNPRVSFAG